MRSRLFEANVGVSIILAHGVGYTHRPRLPPGDRLRDSVYGEVGPGAGISRYYSRQKVFKYSDLLLTELAELG